MEMMQRSLNRLLNGNNCCWNSRSISIIQNLSLIGDGLAHVSFGGVAVAIVLGATNPLWYALLFSVIAAILIHELQARDILTGDASIAIFLTGVLSIGLISLTVWGGGVTADIHSYLFGSQLLIDKDNLNWIATVCIFALIFMAFIGPSLLACVSLTLWLQGYRDYQSKELAFFSGIITAGAVVTMVKVVGVIGYCTISYSCGYGTTSWQQFPFMHDCGRNSLELLHC